MPKNFFLPQSTPYFLFSWVIFLLTILLLPTPASATLSSQRAHHWVPSGQVYTIATDASGTVYVGGNFTTVAPTTTGMLVVYNSSTGAVFSTSTRISGASVNRVISDSAGGFYIGGSFIVHNTTHRSLIHVFADGSLDTGFKPNPNLTVTELYLRTSTLFVGGNFTQIAGTSTAYLAALDATTGAFISWRPLLGGTVNAIVGSTSTLYVGGTFTTVSTTITRNRLAAFDMTSSSWPLTGWNPGVNSTVNDVLLDTSGTTSSIFVFGQFTTTTFASVTRTYASAYDTSGAVTSWNPNITGNYVLSAAMDPAGLTSTIYMVGLFSSVSGTTRANAAAVDMNAATTSWNPNLSTTANTLVYGTSSIFIGGAFTTVGGTTRNRIASVNTTTGSLFGPSFSDSSPSAQVISLALSSSTLAAVGDFMFVSGTVRNYAYAIDSSGSLTDWNPNASAYVTNLTIVTSSVYMTGNFTTISGANRARLAAVNKTTGAPTNFNTSSASFINAVVNTAVFTTSTIYFGGGFTSVSSTTRNRIAALDYGGMLLGWNPGANGAVNTMAFGTSTIYYGGQFTTTSIGTRNRLAAADLDGNVTAWNPGANSDVEGIALDPSGNTTTIYVTGTFTTTSAATRRSAAFDPSGNVTDWNPNIVVSSGGAVMSALCITSSVAYVGGQQTTVGAKAVNLTTGSSTSWNPLFNSDNVTEASVCTIAPDGTLWVGGYFNSTTNTIGAYLSAFEPHTIGFSLTTSDADETTASTTLTLALNATTTDAITVEFTYSTSSAGSADYNTNTSTATISAGATSTSFSVGILGDTIDELNETLAITLRNPFIAILTSTFQHTLTILDNDTSTIAFTSSTYSIGEASSRATSTIFLSTSSSQDIVLTIGAGVQSTAASGTEYSFSTTTVTIPAGSLSADFAITILDNTTRNGDKTVYLTISSPSFGELGSTSTLILTIVDDETGGGSTGLNTTIDTPAEAIRVPVIGGGSVGFTVRLDDPKTKERVVTLRLTGGTNQQSILVADNRTFVPAQTEPYRSDIPWNVCTFNKQCPTGVYQIFVQLHDDTTFPIASTQVTYMAPTTNTTTSTTPTTTPTTSAPTLTVTVRPPTPAEIFPTTLQPGATHPGVKVLQQFLNKRSFVVSKMGPGSLNNETNYFGPATKQALYRYQLKNYSAIYGKSRNKALGVLDRATSNFITKQLIAE